ncbi:putative copper-transporting ATPase PacS [bioreactor metagenome]|uniref:Putative copper-transporting ATPase PacS n=1 Tax=bioreactor metagenome TaxID=1076179 RepID=A0A644ZF08_9ZZZZ
MDKDRDTSIKTTFPVLQMSCAGCAAGVENKIKSLEGVNSAAVNFATATVALDYQPDKIDAVAIQRAVQSIGYDLIIGEDLQQDRLDEIHLQKYNSLKKKTFWSLLLAVPVGIIGMFFMHMPYANFIMWAFSTPVVLWLGRDFFVNAWKQARHGSANMDTLVALSTGTAYLFSVFNMLFPQFWQSKGLEAHVYFEAAAVIIAFILLGRLLEEKAKGSTSSALKKLMGLQPKTVVVVKNDHEQTEVPIEQLMAGDIVLVKPGEKIAVDGTVISGDSFVDESMLSGEPMAVHKTPGEKVFAGTINQKGSFRFRADKVGKETMLAHIIKMVQDAQGSKAPVQKLVDKIAGIFVPVVIGIAILTFFVWLVFGGDNALTHALLAFVTVLVIACPCALGLATPTAIMVGVGKGAEQGILIKDAESLELSQKINAVVLDKTGTITEGKPQVTDELWADESAKSVLASLERQSEHPLAEAVAGHFLSENAVEVTDFQSITGKGIKGVAGGETYFAGNRKLLTENNIAIPEELSVKSDEWSQSAKTVIWFSDSRNALAILAVSDKIKETSVAAVSQMQEMGIDLYMLTGDNEATARAIARQTGIRHYKAEVLPHEKSEFVKQLQQQGKMVAMVGDGINDSAALAQADVSIAMGKGSDIAMDVAKMTIVSSDLTKIPQAVRLSRQTVKTIHQNLFWAFIYNVIGIPVAAGILYPLNGFLLNPMIAGAAMALSSVSVVSNSLRLKLQRRRTPSL